MADKADMRPEEAEAYLKQLNTPEDRWLLEDGRPWWKVGQLEDGRLFGLSGETIRRLLDAGMKGDAGGIPGGVLISMQAGWSVPRSGLLVYVAGVRRQQGHSKLA